MKQKWKNTDTDELFLAVLRLKNLDEARRFFRDLLTVEEILEFTNRFKGARMLDEKKPYSTIARKTGMSSTTIARVSKFLQGKYGGYRLILDRISQKNNHHHQLA